MSKITIGTGLWSTIRSSLNSMFTEIYNALDGIIPGGSSTYEKNDNLIGGETTRVTTTLTKKPFSVFILDSQGIVIFPGQISSPKILLDQGVYVLDIYCSDTINNVNIRITY